MPEVLDELKPDMVIYNAGLWLVGSYDVTCVVCIILSSILGTDVLKGDPLGLLDITDEVVKYLMGKFLM